MTARLHGSIRMSQYIFYKGYFNPLKWLVLVWTSLAFIITLGIEHFLRHGVSPKSAVILAMARCNKERSDALAHKARSCVDSTEH